MGKRNSTCWRSRYRQVPVICLVECLYGSKTKSNNNKSIATKTSQTFQQINVFSDHSNFKFGGMKSKSGSAFCCCWFLFLLLLLPWPVGFFWWEPGCPLRLLHSSLALNTAPPPPPPPPPASSETIRRTVRDGIPGRPPDFHTALELWISCITSRVHNYRWFTLILLMVWCVLVIVSLLFWFGSFWIVCMRVSVFCFVFCRLLFSLNFNFSFMVALVSPCEFLYTYSSFPLICLLFLCSKKLAPPPPPPLPPLKDKSKVRGDLWHDFC